MTVAAPPRPILQMEGITKDFPGVRALSGVTFSCLPGEVHALVGENGAGKSTLMRVLSGVYPDYEGTITISGQHVRFASTRDAERAGISIIHQELNLVDGLSVAENIFLGREPSRFGLVDFGRMNAQARALLAELGMELDPRTPVRALSVGQQQMVEIAKALSVDARIIVMDEPTSALTEHEVEALFSIVRGLRQRGVTVIYITHKIDEIFLIADRVTVLRDGHLVGTRRVSEVTRNELVSMMVGRPLSNMYPERTPRPGRVALEVLNWSLEDPIVRGRYILRDVSFSVREGEILGIAGLMGAGRTELVESIFGAHPGRRSGRVRLWGKEISIGSPQDAIRHGIGLVTEDRKRTGLVLQMTVTHNITLAHLRALCRMGLIDFGAERRVAQTQAQRMRLRAAGLGVLVSTLSGGNQQKVVLGKWLATSPKVLFLDEPTRGIDVGAKAEVYSIMSELAASGMAIVMVSSELPEILGMSDRILVLHEGRVAGELSREEASEERIMFLATGGE